MRCDVLAVGTELLLGQIVDGNSAWIGEQLAAHGIDSLLQVKVGDNVIFTAWAGDEYKDKDGTILIMREEDVLAVVG